MLYYTTGRKCCFFRVPTIRSSFIVFAVSYLFSIVLKDYSMSKYITFQISSWHIPHQALKMTQIGLQTCYYLPIYTSTNYLDHFCSHFLIPKYCSISMEFQIGVFWALLRGNFLLFWNSLPGGEPPPPYFPDSRILKNCCKIWFVCYLAPYHETYYFRFSNFKS